MQLAQREDTGGYLIAPDPKAVRLTRAVTGFDQTGAATEIAVKSAA